ncbi:unnamed protein product [Acidithrix sp. C25]|nr:unnamed protein product [Acidithrix sp. C25]
MSKSRSKGIATLSLKNLTTEAPSLLVEAWSFSSIYGFQLITYKIGKP